MIRLEDHFSFEAFMLLIEYRRRFHIIRFDGVDWRTANQYQNIWNNHHIKVKKQLFDKAFVGFFKAKRAAGELKPISNGVGRHTIFTQPWDLLLYNCQVDRNLISMANRVMVFTGVDSSEDNHLERSYSAMCAVINSGNIPTHMVGIYGDCVNTAEYCQVEFNDWTPVFGKSDNNDPAVFIAHPPVDFSIKKF